MTNNKPYKTTWTEVCNHAGIYLVLPGSNSVFSGFKSVKQANTFLQKLDGWKLLVWGNEKK